MSALLAILGTLLAVVVAGFLLVYVVAPLFRGVAWIVAHIFAFIVGMLSAALRILGGVITTIVFVPLVLGSVLIGRWSAATHYGRGVQNELSAIGTNIYRLFIGHPARFLLLTPLVEGLEKRVPEAVAHAPGPDKPNKKRTGQFDGYTIVGSLKGGGSGGRLYIAEPDERKRAAFVRRGIDCEQVVIKAFSLADGSSLPQIVRENRALDAARKMGLVVEHHMDEHRFFYVMPYVPGDTLSEVTRALHAKSDGKGLAPRELREAIGYGLDLVRTLDTYHRGGLWHKDVKPDNIIVSRGEAHLVDFGLITPLRSAMTLTTHGTEYFRDPEMVRLALRGVKVHEVDGAKFDIYAAGAVIFSVIENSFPAHGGLSQITQRCPDALRWIVRRAMADYASRYASAHEMLGDLRAVQQAADPFALRPADLPSMQGKALEEEPAPAQAAPPVGAVAAASFTPGEGAHVSPAKHEPGHRVAADFAHGAPQQPRERVRPNIEVTNWWSGHARVRDDGRRNAPASPPRRTTGWFHGQRPAPFPGGNGRSAREQLHSARARVDAARTRARKRMARRHARYDNRPNFGVAIAFLLFLGVCLFFAAMVLNEGLSRSQTGGTTAASASGDEESLDLVLHDDISGALSIAPGEVVYAGANGQIRVSSTTGVTIRNGAQPVDPALLAPSRWILLDDAPARGDARDQARRIRATLETVGVRLVTSDSTEEDSLDLLAQVRAAAGVAQSGDPDASKRILRWLASPASGENVAGVLWLGRTDDGEAVTPTAIAPAEPLARSMTRAAILAARGELAQQTQQPSPARGNPARER